MPNLRYKKLGYVALDVTDVPRAIAFHQELVGLEARPGPGPEVAVMRSRSSACDLILYPASEPGLRRIAFEMESPEHLAEARSHLERIGVETWQASPPEARFFLDRQAFRFAEPHTNLTFELYAGEEPPSGALTFEPVTNIVRLGHVVLHADESPAVVDFLVRELNFRVSDYVGGAVFMRCFPSPFHHSLAVVPDSVDHLNHVNFMVDHLDDVGRALHRFRKGDVPIVFGPGRHPPSGSVFLYFTDPDGMTFEFSSGMEEFPETGAREPRQLPLAPESFDYWGSVPTEAYGRVGRFVPPEVPVEGGSR